MARVELWERTGKGITRLLHQIKRRLYVIVLEKESGEQFPIYFGNNEVPGGMYKIHVIAPYSTKEEKKHQIETSPIIVKDDDEVIYLVRQGFLSEAIMQGPDHSRYTEKDWSPYYEKKKENLQIPFGWDAKNAQDMLQYFNKN